jgi:ABC-type nitrate/sulfonate/bicarbonate transport system substrate-binding protein
MKLTDRMKVVVPFVVMTQFAIPAAFAQTSAIPIRISIQPGNYAGAAFKVATHLGYWQQAGLAPTFVPYAAGLAQVKAFADWDVGATGAVPALIGARDHNLITIAVSNDESRSTMLMGRKELVEKIKRDRQIPSGTSIGVTLNSTGDFAAQTCLTLWGGKIKSEMRYTGMTQPEAIAAGGAGTAELVALWAPNSYTMKEKHGFEALCTGNDFSAGVFGAVVANKAWAQANPEIVKKFLAVMLRATKWIQANPVQAQKIHIEGSAKEGVTISSTAAKQDYELRTLYDLDGQISLLSGVSSANESRLVKAFFSLNVFLNEGKPQTRGFRPASFIDSSFLQQVKSDTNLMAFIQK